MSRMINCDATPVIPPGWEIGLEDQISGRVTGELEFNPDKVVFHLEDGQKTRTMSGNDLRAALAGKPVLPATVLDHLLANTALIPESWKKDEHGRTRYLHFWGTIYRDSKKGYLYVRYLYWDDGQWRGYCLWLDDDWDGRNPAALSAS